MYFGGLTPNTPWQCVGYFLPWTRTTSSSLLFLLSSSFFSFFTTYSNPVGKLVTVLIWGSFQRHIGTVTGLPCGGLNTEGKNSILFYFFNFSPHWTVSLFLSSSLFIYRHLTVLVRGLSQRQIRTVTGLNYLLFFFPGCLNILLS